LNRGVGGERYKDNLGRVARGAGISSFGQGLGRVLAYVTQVVLARMFGPAQYGFFALGVTIVGFATLVAQAGLPNPVVRFVAQYETDGDAPRVRGTILLALGVSFAISLVLSILMFLGAGFLADKVLSKPSIDATLRAFSISVPFVTLMTMALWGTLGFRTIKYLTLVRDFLQPLATLVLIVAFYPLGAQILGAVVAYVVATILGTVLAFYYLIRMFPELLKWDVPPIFESQKIFSDARKVFVALSAEYLNAWTGVIVLGILGTSAEVGIFNAVARTALVSGILYTAWTDVFSPVVSSLYGRGQLGELDHLYMDVSRWIFTSGLAVFWVTALLSKDILLVFGDAFVSGWVAMIIMAGGQFLNMAIGATNRVLLMTGHQRAYMVAMVASVVTGFVASFALVPLYGLLGAALAYMGTTVLASVITLTAIRRAMNLWPYNREYLRPLIAGFLAAALVLLARWFLPVPAGVTAILVVAPLFMVCFVLVLMILGLTPSDRQLLRSLWTAVRRTD
jgi:O-antigen/teichoic acid export membrane protein